MLNFAQHTSYYQCLQQHCCKGRRGEHYVINHGCLYEPIIKRMVTAVKHSTNHKKSTDIISMIVEFQSRKFENLRVSRKRTSFN